MATIRKVPNGYEFRNLSAAGVRMVNEFQRLYPAHCKPALRPDLRVIWVGSSEQSRMLEKLVADIRVRDPEVKAHFQRFKFTWN